MTNFQKDLQSNLQAGAQAYVQALEQAYRSALGRSSSVAPRIPALGSPPMLQGGHDTPQVLIVAPHPDDECLMGSYALRMKQEWGARIAVYPFTLGSDLARQDERWLELSAATQALGFDLCDSPTRGGIPLDQVMTTLKPEIVFSPHLDDGHRTHIACAQATQAALLAGLQSDPTLQWTWNQTEFWHSMREPNLLIPLATDHVIQMVFALSFHRGEVARNPYHLRLPAWYMDQVRKSERVHGPGSSGYPDWVFGQLYTQIKLAAS